MLKKYVLDIEGQPLRVDDLTAWAEWFEHADTTIALDRQEGDVTISTVFLGIDLRMFSPGEPLLFETMIFGGPRHLWCRRYSTKAEALAGHAEALQLAIDGAVK